MDLFLCSSLYQNCRGSFLDIYVTKASIFLFLDLRNIFQIIWVGGGKKNKNKIEKFVRREKK